MDIDIPAIQTLADYDQWVAWDDQEGRKIPIDPHRSVGRPVFGSVDDSFCRASLSRALRCARHYGLSGVGFVFVEDDPFVGVDLDDCLDPETGVLDGWAAEIVGRLSTYCEVSPSGCGLKLIGRGEIPSAVKAESGLEMYDRSRYFTVTGEVWDGLDRIEDVGETVESLWSAHHERTVKTVERHGSFSDAYDEDRRAEDWVGDALSHIPPDDYHLWVRVGFALRDEFGDGGLELWDQWSRGSPKYPGPGDIEQKWRSFDAGEVGIGTVWYLAERYGWEGPDFELDLAGWDVDDWLPDSSTDEAGAGEPSQQDDEDGGVDHAIQWLDYAEVYEDDSPFDPYYIEPYVLGRGDLMLWAGPPKSMKTLSLQAMCRNFAAGIEWMGLEPTRPLKIAYLNCELKADSIRQRAQLCELPSEMVERIRDNFKITERFTRTLDAEFVELAVESMLMQCGTIDIDVLVIDTAAQVFPFDNENDNSQMSKFIRRVQYLTQCFCEDAATILVHHVGKVDHSTVSENPMNSPRGASALRGAYDSGFLLARRPKTDQISVYSELRNGPGIDPWQMTFDVERGRFVELDASQRVAGKTQGDRWSAEHARRAELILKILRQQAARGKVYTKRQFARTFANDDDWQIGSVRAVTEKISEMAAKHLVAYFDAGEYGGPPKVANSHGHLCTSDMALLTDEQTGEAVEVEPQWVCVPGQSRPVPVEQVDDFTFLTVEEYLA